MFAKLRLLISWLFFLFLLLASNVLYAIFQVFEHFCLYCSSGEIIIGLKHPHGANDQAYWILPPVNTTVLSGENGKPLFTWYWCMKAPKMLSFQNTWLCHHRNRWERSFSENAVTTHVHSNHKIKSFFGRYAHRLVVIGMIPSAVSWLPVYILLGLFSF